MESEGIIPEGDGQNKFSSDQVTELYNTCITGLGILRDAGRNSRSSEEELSRQVESLEASLDVLEGKARSGDIEACSALQALAGQFVSIAGQQRPAASGDSESQRELDQLEVAVCKQILDDADAEEDVQDEAYDRLFDLTRHQLCEQDRALAGHLLRSLKALGEKALAGDLGAHDFLFELIVPFQRLGNWIEIEQTDHEEFDAFRQETEIVAKHFMLDAN